MKFDVAVFGSATYDTYVVSDEFTLRKSPEGSLLCGVYGKKIELDECVVTTGGGATNAAVAFERLGLQSALVACIGKDFWGRVVRVRLEEEGVSLLYLQTSADTPTSSSIALVGKDGNRTMLVHRAASNELSWRHVDWDRLSADWAYVSSLGGDFTLLTKIIRFCQEKHIKLAFNPGGGELAEAWKLRRLLGSVAVLLVNKQEAQTLFETEKITPKTVGKVEAELVVVTDGENGACAYEHTGIVYKQKIHKVKAVEVTGAGDAFGSSFVAGQIRGLSTQDSLRLAAFNSASVVCKIGPKAGLLFWPEAQRLLTSKVK